MLYLASQSPRRSQLLGQIGVQFTVLTPPEGAEALEAQRAGEAPARYVQRVTLAKLQAAQESVCARGLPPAPVLCADTCVALGRCIYGKPRDAADAARMLAELAGRAHTVLTAVALGVPGVAQPLRALSRSRVRFAPLTKGEIAAYVASGEPQGKAGAYAVQGLAAAFIQHISGSYSGVMGLPLYETAQLLRAAGLHPLPGGAG